RQDREGRVEAPEEPLRREKLRSSRCELDREWEPVEPPANRLDRGVGRELPPDRTGALDEEGGRVLCRQRLEPILPLARHVQRRSARDEDAETARGGEDRADGGGGGGKMLEGGEEDGERPTAENSREVGG